jgi:hypothetical protein
MVHVWESLSLKIGYAKAVLVGVPAEEHKLVLGHEGHRGAGGGGRQHV